MKLNLTNRQKGLLSLLMGIGVMVLIMIYWKKEERRVQNQFTMTRVLQARKYLKQGQKIDPASVDEKSIPVAFLPPGALQDKNELLNSKGDPFLSPRLSFMKGEMITKMRLKDESMGENLSWSLNPGQNAVSIKLSFEQAVGGYLQAGDRVHIFCTLNDQPGIPTGQSAVFLQNIRVLAVGDQYWDPAGVVAHSSKTNSTFADSVCVTLGLTLQETQKLLLAVARGTIVLGLVSPLDSQISKIRPMQISDLW